MRALNWLLLLSSVVNASVIGIDYGTEWFKVSIVKPGVPLDIVLNRESKRKTSAVVTIRDGVRFFGSDSVSLSSRYPSTTYPFLKGILGRKFSDPAVSSYRSSFENGLIEDDQRGTCAFKTASGEIYSVEELVGMQLAHARRQAEAFGGEPVSGAIISVPPFFNQFQRNAVLDAAEVAGLKVLGLMNGNTAVALNYAMTRNFNETQYHIFFDAGAGSTVASLVKFQNVDAKEGKKVKAKAIVQVEVVAVAHDESLGGLNVDLELQRFLADRFITDHGRKTKTLITDSPRSMTKLLKEANRVKQILSANQETFASIEGLHEDIDFRVKVTRAELEGLMGDYLQRFPKPVLSVLQQTGIPMANISSVVLVGGSVRMPAAQAALKSIVGEDKIALNVNQDEAAVLGAGFRAASISTQFKVREIRVGDITDHPIEVFYESEGKVNSDRRSLRTSLYARNAHISSKKLMNFKRTSDFTFDVAYIENQVPIYRAAISGLSAAFEKYKETSIGAPKVKALIELNDSGVLSVNDATAVFELEQSKPDTPSLKDTVFSFFGGGKKRETDEDTTDQSDTANEEKDSRNTTEIVNNTVGKEVGKKIITEKVQLTLTLNTPAMSPLSVETKSKVIQRFAAMDADDAKRRAREEARNGLEAFIYSSSDFIENEDVIAISTEKEREKFRGLLTRVQEWLVENGEDADTEEFRSYFEDLRTLHSPLHRRREEDRLRPAAVAQARASVQNATAFVNALEVKATNNSDDNASHLHADMTSLKKLAEDTEKWLNEREIAQSKLKRTDDPVFTLHDIETKRLALEREIMKVLTRKPKSARAKVASSPRSTSTPAAANGTNPDSKGNNTDYASNDESGHSTQKPDAGNASGDDVPRVDKDHDEL